MQRVGNTDFYIHILYNTITTEYIHYDAVKNKYVNYKLGNIGITEVNNDLIEILVTKCEWVINSIYSKKKNVFYSLNNKITYQEKFWVIKGLYLINNSISIRCKTLLNSKNNAKY